MAADPSTASRCLCEERGLLGVHEEPCADFGSRSDELCEQAERESVEAGDWLIIPNPRTSSSIAKPLCGANWPTPCEDCVGSCGIEEYVEEQDARSAAEEAYDLHDKARLHGC